MTQAEQQQIEQLREQLSNANRNFADARAHFLSALGRSNEELRLYRGLFWCLFTIIATATILWVAAG